MEEVKKKKCNKCGEEKPATNEYFYRNSKSKDELTNDCRECRNEHSKEIYRLKQPKKDQTIKSIELYKICKQCNRKLLNTEEYFTKTSYKKKDGIYSLSNICKNCTNEQSKIYNKNKKNINKKRSDTYSVYAHINKLDDKRYIGFSKDAKQRWRYGKGYKGCDRFYKAIKTYGWGNFEHIIIGKGLTKEDAEYFEILLINRLDTTNPEKGYNIAKGGAKGLKGLVRYGGSCIRVYCDEMIFSSINQCAKYYNIETQTMRNWIKGISGMPQSFINMNLHGVDKQYDIKPDGRVKKVICDGIIFNSILECCDYYNIKYVTIYTWLSGKVPMRKEFQDMGLKYHIEENENSN